MNIEELSPIPSIIAIALLSPSNLAGLLKPGALSPEKFQKLMILPHQDLKKEWVDPKILNDKNIYPDEATLKKLFVITARDPATQRVINRLWTKVKTGR